MTTRKPSPTRVYVAICTKTEGCQFWKFRLPNSRENTVSNATRYFMGVLDTNCSLEKCVTIEDYNNIQTIKHYGPDEMFDVQSETVVKLNHG